MTMALANSLAFSEDTKGDRQKKEFYGFAMTRSWGYATWKIEHMEEGLPRLEETSSLVAFAFKYWLLTRDGIIERNSSFERQIRATISEGKIPMPLIEDPLARLSPGGTFTKGAGRIIGEEEYATLTKEFRTFVEAKPESEKPTAEQGSSSDGDKQPN